MYCRYTKQAFWTTNSVLCCSGCYLSVVPWYNRVFKQLVYCECELLFLLLLVSNCNLPFYGDRVVCYLVLLVVCYRSFWYKANL